LTWTDATCLVWRCRFYAAYMLQGFYGVVLLDYNPVVTCRGIVTSGRDHVTSMRVVDKPEARVRRLVMS